MSKPWRILYFVPYLPASRSGILQAQTFGQARVLTRSGRFECMIVAADLPGRTGHVRALPALQGIADTLISERYPQKANFSSLIALGETVAQDVLDQAMAWKPDCVYVRDGHGVLAVRDLVRRLGCPCVFDVRGLGPEEVRLRRQAGSWPVRMTAPLAAWVTERRERTALRLANRVAAVTRYLADWAERLADKKDVAVIPCCVDGQTFCPDPTARHRLREQLGWPDKAPVVVYSGGTSVWQRLSDILAVLATVQADMPQLRVLLLTDAAREVTAMAHQAGLQKGSCIAQFVHHDQVADWLSLADAGIVFRHDIPLNNAASPVKVAEYLAAGLPVIATTGIGELSGLLRRTGTGVVLEAHHPSAVQAGEFLEHCLAEPALRQRAQQVAAEHLTFQAHLPAYERLFAPETVS